MSVLISFIEVIGIGALIPFINLLTDESFINSPNIVFLIELFDFLNFENIHQYLTIGLIILLILTGFTRIFHIYFTNILIAKVGNDISTKYFSSLIREKFEFFLDVNSSDLISGIANKNTSIITSVIIPCATIIYSIIIIIVITAFLLFINPKMSLSLFVSFLLIYSLISFYTKSKLSFFGKNVNSMLSTVIEILNNSIGSIYDLKLNNKHHYFEEKFIFNDQKLRLNQSMIQIYAQTPRFIIEMFSVVILVIICYILFDSKNSLINFLPILVVFAISFQKMLPLAQQSFYSLSVLIGGRETLNDILRVINLKLINKNHKRIISGFKSFISYSKISFHHKNNITLFNNLNFKISKGDWVGVSGPSGSGKSTLIQILSGLRKPSSGYIAIDNLKKRSDFNSLNGLYSIVPQKVFIFNHTLRNNVAFGTKKEEIDDQRVKWALDKSGFYFGAKSNHIKLDSYLGDNGSKISGGQMQRIGIARALYYKKDILILDEATNALDKKTETFVLNSLKKLENLTVVLITHHPENLKYCNKLINLSHIELE